MNLHKSMELIKRYGECKGCKSKVIGNGEGTLRIDGNTFKRTCKCGYLTHITVSDGE